MKAAVSRIQSAFERLARERRKALIPYVTAGDPRAEVTVPLMRALVAAGGDVNSPCGPLFASRADRPVVPPARPKGPKKQNGTYEATAVVSAYLPTGVAVPLRVMG